MRKVTSIILGLTFIVISATGLQMGLFRGGEGHGRPPAIQGNEAGDNLNSSAGRERHQPSFYPKLAHEWAGYLFVIGGLGHMILNFKTLASYLRRKDSK